MIRRAAIRALPRPDSAEFGWEPGRVCVVLGDDAPLAAALEKRLAARGWRVEVHAHPDGDPGAPATPLDRVGALVTLAPRAPAPSAPTLGEALLGNTREEAWLHSQFRLARELSPALNAAGPARAWFVAVTRLDGKLGLAPSARPSGVVAAGVYGLVKTLRLEWPSVFCRAIDLHPALDPAFAAERIVEELHDPDRTLGEVGHGLDGRWTIGASEEADA